MSRRAARVALAAVVAAAVTLGLVVRATPANGLLWVVGGRSTSLLNMAAATVATTALILAGFAFVFGFCWGLRWLWRQAW